MASPFVAGDPCGPYQPPAQPLPPLAGICVGGSVKVLIRGRAVALIGAGLTSIGPIVAATLVSTKTLIEGKPVILGGGLTTLATGYHSGPVFAVNAATVQVT